MNRKKIVAVALCTKISWDFIFDSDSEDSDDEKKINPRNEMYYENTICSFNEEKFRIHFRILPSTLEILYQNLTILESRYVDVSRGHPKIALEKQITIWYLANTECFRSVSDRFGISINACWQIVFNISRSLLKLNYKKNIIGWPSERRALEISDYFKAKMKFPGIIGCIDGSHIAIPAPKEHPNSYINRKKYHSVLLQGVCDEKMAFIDCYAGEVGSIHDSCLFRRSSLYNKISNGSIIIPEDQHMLGDLGYGLKSYLMTPFKDTGNLSNAQKSYNTHHSAARSTIERAFVLLKGRFRRLTILNTRRPDLIPLLIMTGCILHNICLQNGDYLLENFNISTDDGSSDPAAITHSERNAKTKRNQILQIINM